MISLFDWLFAVCSVIAKTECTYHRLDKTDRCSTDVKWEPLVTRMDVSGAELNYSHKHCYAVDLKIYLRSREGGVRLRTNRTKSENVELPEPYSNPAKERRVWTVRSNPLTEWKQNPCVEETVPAVADHSIADESLTSIFVSHGIALLFWWGLWR